MTVVRAYGMLAAILDIAVPDRRTEENSVRGITLPRKQRKRRVYLTHRQVEILATQAQFPDLVMFPACTALRWGEATGPRVRDVDAQRLRVHVQENAVMVKPYNACSGMPARP